MRVTIRQKNLEITPALRQYIESNFLRPLGRLFKNSVSEEFPLFDLELGRGTFHHRKGKVYRAEVSLVLGGKIFYAHAEDENVRSAIDVLKEDVEREILKFKGREMARGRRRARRIKRELRFAAPARIRANGRVRNEGN